jgi:hypothetical protein
MQPDVIVVIHCPMHDRRTSPDAPVAAELQGRADPWAQQHGNGDSASCLQRPYPRQTFPPPAQNELTLMRLATKHGRALTGEHQPFTI